MDALCDDVIHYGKSYQTNVNISQQEAEQQQQNGRLSYRYTINLI